MAAGSSCYNGRHGRAHCSQPNYGPAFWCPFFGGVPLDGGGLELDMELEVYGIRCFCGYVLWSMWSSLTPAVTR